MRPGPERAQEHVESGSRQGASGVAGGPRGWGQTMCSRGPAEGPRGQGVQSWGAGLRCQRCSSLAV